MMAASLEQLADGLKSLLCAADAQALTRELADWDYYSIHDGAGTRRPGHVGR
jgi:hypothetical protein